MLAWFHEASAPITPAQQRPNAWPLPLPPDGRMDRQLRAWLDATNEDLVHIGHSMAPRLVIHGDFTVDNVIATGSPA
jgi:Ser/Thr protein kinase RdoA (MazF antagonist)